MWIWSRKTNAQKTTTENVNLGKKRHEHSKTDEHGN